ncbi:hypothetical protein HYU50_00720 [Candidatus Woesearchaeota archaeon]|nr:hypothetical protein [Candidatus Woesearchaeota archaeon]
MKKANRAYIENNKKQKYALNKTSKLFSFTSTLKLTLALALFFIAAFMISGAGVTVENGALNVSNSLTVNTSALFVDSANNRVGIGTTAPKAKLHILAGTSLASFYNAQSPLIIEGGTDVGNGNVNIQIIADKTRSTSILFSNQTSTSGYIAYAHTPGSMSFATNAIERMLIDSSGNVGIGTASPNQKLMVAGNANITGTVYYGALQANSPVLERTAEPFVAKCTIADDGKLVVEYIHNEAGAYSRVIEAVNPDSSSWHHRSCFEKNGKFDYLDSLLSSGIKLEEIIVDGDGNQNTMQRDPNIEDIGFDWNTKTAYLIE